MEKRGNVNRAPNELTLKSKDDEEKPIPPASYSKDEEWVQEYIRQFGEEPSFF